VAGAVDKWEGRKITLEITPGELLDRLTILELKLEHCTRDEQRSPLAAAIDRARATRRAARIEAPGLRELEQELANINHALWRAEDEIRDREARADHGDGFVAVARGICRLNDRRTELKRAIDRACGFPTTEGKTYAR
jgi:hypothetical protein